MHDTKNPPLLATQFRQVSVAESPWWPSPWPSGSHMIPAVRTVTVKLLYITATKFHDYLNKHISVPFLYLAKNCDVKDPHKLRFLW